MNVIGLFIALLVGISPPAYVEIQDLSRLKVCTAIPISQTELFTAAHCLYPNSRYYLIGPDLELRVELLDRTSDFAVVSVSHQFNSYETDFAPPDYGLAISYGKCPQTTDLPKILLYLGPSPYGDVWYALTPVCGGDSGGPVVQGGKVVGMVLSLYNEAPKGKNVSGHVVLTRRVGQ